MELSCRDDQQTKFYTDGVKQAIELYGTPSCKRKLLAVSNVFQIKHSIRSFLCLQPTANTSSERKSNDPNVRMIQDMFPDLDEKYIQVSFIERREREEII